MACRSLRLFTVLLTQKPAVIIECYEMQRDFFFVRETQLHGDVLTPIC